ncbi:MAG: ClpXP protease specificity-enhancing factor [Burkholderiaceae bacterium]|jgi:stringent starvation protein B|nr:ClpXP protease specificity-enhancing factor [Burkholderiaceae bacterium]
MLNAIESSSTRPYLIRAIFEWCNDNGLTPYVAVQVDNTVQVPREYVKDGQIVLNISYDATGALKLGNDLIEFKARFAGIAREILVPINRVMAIYARENGQGIAFPPLNEAASDTEQTTRFPAPVSRRGDHPPARLVTPDTPGAGLSSDPAGMSPEGPAPRPPEGGGMRPKLKRIK